MRDYPKSVLLGIFWAGIQTLSTPGQEPTLADIVLQFTFSRMSIEVSCLIEAVFRFIPLFVFQMLFGVSIYRHFCETGIYYFSRCSNRYQWYLGEVIHLLKMAVTMNSIALLVCVCLCALNHPVKISGAAFVLGMVFIVVYSMWLLCTSLIINVISLHYGGDVGFPIVGGIQILLVALLALHEVLLPIEEQGQQTINLIVFQLNPISHLVLSWHSSIFDDVNQIINQFGIEFDLLKSVIYMAVCMCITVVVGAKIIRHKELIVANSEGRAV